MARLIGEPGAQVRIVHMKLDDSVVELFGTGKVDPLISDVRPLSEALDALEDIGNRRTVGKVIIRPGE